MAAASVDLRTDDFLTSMANAKVAPINSKSAVWSPMSRLFPVTRPQRSVLGFICGFAGVSSALLRRECLFCV